MASLSRRLSWAGTVLLGALLAVTAVGCGFGKGDISGKVTYKGEPLKGGTVAFVASEGPSFSGEINEDGTYTVFHVRSGTYKVCVDTEVLKPHPQGAGGASGYGPQKGAPAGFKGPPTGFGPPGTGSGDLQKDVKSGKIKASGGEAATGAAQGGYKDGFASMAANAARYREIPGKYAKPESTDLTFDARTGAQTFEINLKD
ncbi:MAG TPA: carboxypeptidase-like regulatory domain-containing protein [Gemmataceae bacterium]|nr:carboxypeptidase-like regulatory domain-containing protein [Gemmataceae bacterium]